MLLFMSRKVYLIRAGQFYKIGVSGSVDKRLKHIQTGCPIKCEYVGYFPTDSPEEHEKNLHQQYSSALTHGEWFELGDDHIKHMIVEHNLKYVITPFSKVTGDTKKISECAELKLARNKTSEIDEFIEIFEGICDWYKLTQDDRKVISNIISEFGIEICVKALYNCLEFAKPNQIFSKIKSSCKAYRDYGRFVPKSVWRYYFMFLKDFDKHEANKMLHFIMASKLDQHEYFDLYFNELCLELYKYNCADEVINDLIKDIKTKYPV